MPVEPPVTSLYFWMTSGNSVARARVTRARYRPLMRRAGSPTSTPMAKHSTIETGRVVRWPQPWSAVRMAVV